jgi:transposase
MDTGQSTPAAAASLGLSAKAVWQIGKRYQQGGLERALYDASRPGAAPALDGEQRQRIIAVACSHPPSGRARWTVRLLTAEVIKRNLVPRAGRETIRVLLESHDLKPWRGKMLCVGKLDEEYIARMGELLGLYEKPWCERATEVCLDEKTVVLHADIGSPQAMQPARAARRGYEYRRCGTANVFCEIEP